MNFKPQLNAEMLMGEYKDNKKNGMPVVEGFLTLTRLWRQSSGDFNQIMVGQVSSEEFMGHTD